MLRRDREPRPAERTGDLAPELRVKPTGCSIAARRCALPARSARKLRALSRISRCSSVCVNCIQYQ
jgi:hypothetical protein